MGHVAQMLAQGGGLELSPLLGPPAGSTHPALSAAGEHSWPDLPEQGAGPSTPQMDSLRTDVLAFTVATGSPS